MTEAIPMTQRHGVGHRVAAARRSRGMTQKQLADAIGVSPWAVERIESGQTDATSHLLTIADVTQSEPGWFLRPPVGHVDAQPGMRRPEVAHLGVAGQALVLGAIAVLVTARFFTEVVPVVPRATNFVDIPIFLALAVAAMVVPPGIPQRSAYMRFGAPSAAFLILCVLSAIVNSHRTEAAPVVVFVYAFLAPLGVYAAAYRIWPPGSGRSLSRLLVALGMLQLFVVGLVSLPRSLAAGGNPDLISGTFGTNQYQLVFFLLLVSVLLAGIYTLEPSRPVARFAPLLILSNVVVILLAQYRAILATVVISIAVVGILLGGKARGVLLTIFAVVAFSIAFSVIASRLPDLRLYTTASTLSESPWSYVSARYEGTLPVRRLYGDDPFVSAFGTGPGTFSSRAWQTFALADSTSTSNVQGGYAQRLTGGIYATDVSDKYVVPQADKGLVIEGSAALTKPWSSYLGLLAEVGLLGFALIVGVYAATVVCVWRLARAGITTASGTDTVPALALATTLGFLTLLQMALLENWLEVTRLTFIVWLMFAVVSKELDARPQMTE